ncbi:hypothetical protein Tco_0990084 [Tanacetum coccineum]|uniref:Uncharacterized protein n=1 Tax=Tanacetum coccineum TaxID=301880 RepID=A0ABQ5EVN9_9ASTR
MVYQNFLREFWCTAIAYDLNPPKNNSEERPLKEYLIKFSVMNGKKPLTLDYKTFVESAGLDYAKGKYLSHPSTEEVLGGNYSSTEQVNSIQQLFAYYLLIGTKKKKGKSQTVTSTTHQSQGPEASGTLPQKRKYPKSKMPPTKTKVTPHPS